MEKMRAATRTASLLATRVSNRRLRMLNLQSCVLPVVAVPFKRNRSGDSESRSIVLPGVALVCAVAFAKVSECKGVEIDEKLKARIGSRLEPIRSERRSSPSVKIGKYEENTLGISFVVPSSAVVIQTISVLVGALRGSYRLRVEGEEGESMSIVFEDGSGSILLQPQDESRFELLFFKEKGDFSDTDLDAFAAAYARGAFTKAGSRVFRSNLPSRDTGGFSNREPQSQNGREADPYAKLESLGAIVYRHEQDSESGGMDWSCLAGYENVQREVEDTVLLGLKHPDEFDIVTRKTRERFESNRPRAILFEGPPGTGKTTTARIVANLSSVPMIYIPVESVMSKWFGESEARLSEILALCDSLGNSIVFLDEVDSLATARDSGGNMHEATRRILSVLLRALEGFQESSRSILIAATNRKQDLDAALVSRFDITIPFPLPTFVGRKAIFARYAKQLSEEERGVLAERASGFSGRDIKDVCKHAERRWVSEQLRNPKKMTGSLEIEPPPFPLYVEALVQRQSQVLK